jgi:uncharacterized tellurite resistance protein B-like protein
MLDAIRDFIRRLGQPQDRQHYGDDDVRLALAALLVHATEADGAVSPAERGKLRDLLGRTFGVSGADLGRLIEDAVAAEQEAVDLYRFTSVLKRQMGEEERIRVVELLWEIAYADGTSHEFEENLVWRVAELLGVNPRDRIARKAAVAESRTSSAGDLS